MSQMLQNEATIAHSVSTKILKKEVARIPRRRIGRKLRIYVEKISFDIEEQKESGCDITGILDTDKEFCVCFIDWQKALTV